ncbi:hypothetical protein GUITHDRAFT_103804 [Guillardia theta CCMP2712]|uniref:Major facilitator superfamily (MFS) profile domain-containing protein n=1 Tax=Guillardia theta (strain CCMP2712) TaxID=905079 RepID=L1JR59_GUITC|nr:hypothetical protein GUITHDRAFT_103804 [Guillardia theta CCMP2712]EKX50578.1 hypothetical protein GUITHDRAFT_103804 [Guillardia theta CCMP2712]|eukprot:XP_005837558.1 hypothetical protein GUITHDRAFT_103804 [Guillardia theta CCMP2712]
MGGLSSLALSYFYKSTLKADPALLSSISSISALPWTCKPIYGFLSDAYPLLGFRRRPYLALGGAAAALSWIYMATYVNDPWTGGVCMTFGSAGMAVANVMAEAILVERSQGETQEFASHLQSVVWGAASVGSLISSFLGGYLLEIMSDRQVFLLSAVFPLTLVPLSLLSPEKRRESDKLDPSDLSNKVRALYLTLMMPEILYPTLFIFMLNATPSTGSAWFYFYSSKPPLGVGFSAEFLGTINVVGSIFNLAGVILFQSFLRTLPFRPLLLWGTIVSSVLGLSNLVLVFHVNRQWNIPDEWFCLGEGAVQAVVGWISTMPIIVLASRLCPEGMEATMYALIMSINNLGGVLGSQLGALITMWLGVSSSNLDHFWLLVTICNVSSLVPLVFINWIPAGDPQLVRNRGMESLT